MKTKLSLILILIFTFALIPKVDANPTQPGQYLMQQIDAVVVVLKNQNFKTKEEKQVFKNRLLNFLEVNFDWETIARNSLNAHWDNFSADQQKLFTNMFRNILQNICLGLAHLYTGESVTYIKEEIKNGSAKVYLKFNATNGKKFDAVVDLNPDKSGWRVYEISAEGISIIDNYRAQFNSVIHRFSIQRLMQIMQEKT